MQLGNRFCSSSLVYEQLGKKGGRKRDEEESYAENGQGTGLF